MNKSGSKINSSRRRCLKTLATLPLLSHGLLHVEQSEAAKRTALEGKVNRYIRRLRFYGLIKPDEKTAWSVYDLHKKQKLVSINENSPFQSASMIKPFIALAYFYRLKYDKKHFKYTPKIRRKMEAMIRDSSNSATNYFIRIISKKPKSQRPAEVEKILKKNAPGIFRYTQIKEYIPRNGRTYRNKAAARDYSRFLYALWNNDLPYATELKRLMGLRNSDRLITGVDNIPKITKVYDKTGTTARLCGDMGIIVAKGRNGHTYPYTMIGIIEKKNRAKNYGQWAKSRSEVIRSVSGMVYDEFKIRYSLI